MGRGRGGERGDDQSLNWLVVKAEGNGNPDHVVCQTRIIHIFPLLISTTAISPTQVHATCIASSLRAYRGTAKIQAASPLTSYRSNGADENISPTISAVQRNVMPSVTGDGTTESLTFPTHASYLLNAGHLLLWYSAAPGLRRGFCAERMTALTKLCS